jgi:hypothetical protein
MAYRDTTRRYQTPGQIITTSGTSNRVTNPINANEVLVHASARCFIAVGDSTVAATSAGIPLEAGEKFHLKLNYGQYIAAIQDTAAGTVNVITVQL